MNPAMILAVNGANWFEDNKVTVIVGAIVLLIALVFLVIFFSFLRLWIQSFLTGAKIGIFDLIGMKLRSVDYAMIVRQKIALVQAGVKVSTQDMEAHYLSRGNVPKTATAVIAAHKAGMDLPWRVAAAIDLAGRDILDAVKTSVNPKVIDCPDPSKGRTTLEGVCKNGIQLRAKARVTVRTKLDRLVGGATEETIIARVGEGIVKAIGSAEHHTDVLANPNLISQAAADLRVAQANAEKRRALAVAQEQEMRARVEENRAQVVLAEAEVPRAISEAFRSGRLGVMDYYNLRTLQSDTQMRNAIAGNNTERNERPIS